MHSAVCTRHLCYVNRTSYPLNLEYDDITLKYCAYRFIYLYDSSAPRQTEELNTADNFFGSKEGIAG